MLPNAGMERRDIGRTTDHPPPPNHTVSTITQDLDQISREESTTDERTDQNPHRRREKASAAKRACAAKAKRVCVCA